MADQALVSGVNFVTGIFLARYLGLEGYGKFVLLYAVLLYVNTIQNALIILPMMSIFPKIEDVVERERFTSGILTLQVWLVVGSVVLLAVSGIALDYIRPAWDLRNYYFPLGATIFFFQLQDWLRRYYFCGFRPVAVLVNDFISYGGQLLALVVLHLTGVLSVETVLWAIAATSALAFISGYFMEHFVFCYRDALTVYKQSIAMAKDYFLSSQLQWAGSQGVLMISGGLIGAEATGGIRAAQNVVGPVNILYQAMENIVPVKAAREFARNNIVGLKHYLSRVSTLGSVAILLPCFCLAVFSETLMQLLYGDNYVKYSSLVLWQAAYMYLGFFYRQAVYFHRAMNSTKILVVATISVALITIVASFVMIRPFQESGLMCALILGQFLGIGVVGSSVYKIIRNN
jgi:O-antigen/teichoic acid export membrane protein